MIFFGRVPQRVGYATDGRSWLLTNPLKPSGQRRHQVHYYLDLAGAISANVERPSIEIQATSEERSQARKLLAAGGVGHDARFLVMNPGAAYGSAKRWGEDRFADAGDRLAEELGLDVVIVGSETERSIAERIQRRMRHQAVILNGRTSLETLMGVIAESSLMLTNDSGPMHISAALGVPTVAVFGATDDVVTGPYGARVRVVKQPVDCSPCMLRECPIDHPCMTQVSAESVCRAAQELLHA